MSWEDDGIEKGIQNALFACEIRKVPLVSVKEMCDQLHQCFDDIFVSTISMKSEITIGHKVWREYPKMLFEIRGFYQRSIDTIREMEDYCDEWTDKYKAELEMINQCEEDE
jgi:hypothetical protein